MTDVYKTPSANLVKPVSVDGYGSLERGIAGQYQFSIRDIIREAWNKTSGVKGTIWLAMILYLVIAVPVSIGVPFILELVGLPSEPDPGQAMTATMFIGIIVSQVVVMLVTLPLGAGLFMVGLKIASGVDVSASEVLNYFHKSLTLLGTVIVLYIMLIIGFMLLVIPGIYLMFAYYLAIPLVVEKGLRPWQALEASRKAVSKRWFRFAGLSIALWLLMIVAAIPLGIGLIWVLPLMLIAYGIAYRNIFGFGAAPAA